MLVNVDPEAKRAGHVRFLRNWIRTITRRAEGGGGDQDKAEAIRKTGSACGDSKIEFRVDRFEGTRIGEVIGVMVVLGVHSMQQPKDIVHQVVRIWADGWTRS